MIEIIDETAEKLLEYFFATHYEIETALNIVLTLQKLLFILDY